MKYLLVLSVALTLIAGCKSTDELKPVGQIKSGVAAEGTLANQQLIADAKRGLEELIGKPIKESELLKFVIQQPVGNAGSRSWREMWVLKTAEEESQFIMTFKEAGMGAADFEIKKMTNIECPKSVSNFKEGQNSEFIKSCLGKPDNIDKNPDGRYIYFYYRSKGVVLTYLFSPNDELIRFSAYQDTK